MITRAYVEATNEAFAKLQLEAARIGELPVELEQLRAAIEAVEARVDFDVDPSDFRAALIELATAGAKHD